VKTLGKLAKRIAVFAVAAMVSLCVVGQSRAFTLIETQFVPAVQLVASQTAMVKVSNVSLDTIDITVSILAHNGALLVTHTVSLPAGVTFSLPYVKPAGTPSTDIRAVVTTGTANAAVSSLMTLDKVSGEVIAILPFRTLP
jgi:hypothetical protein